jgi:hypothetical protein
VGEVALLQGVAGEIVELVLVELLLFTYPAVLGAGRPLFDSFDRGISGRSSSTCSSRSRSTTA